MLSLFIIEDLEDHISGVKKSSSEIDGHDENSDVYYFFCSSEKGSRRSAVSVFRSLIYQIVSKHEDLMKHVLDYLENNRPVHASGQSDNDEVRHSRNPEKKDERSRSVVNQNIAEQTFPMPGNFAKNMQQAALKGGQEFNLAMRKEAPHEETPEDGPKNKSSLFQNPLCKSRKEDLSSGESETSQVTGADTGPANLEDPPERESPKSRQLELLEVSELSFILRKLIGELDVDKVYFLLDGVDECVKEEQEALTSIVLNLPDVKPGKFKLIVVSQAIGGMGRIPTIKLEETQQTRGDIEKFVSKSVEQLEHVDGFKEIQREVEESLLEGADDTFLWVSLVMREIETKTTATEIVAETKRVPKGLNQKYSRMLQQIDQPHRQKVYPMLRWVTAAIRPLTLQELSEVVEVPASDNISPVQAVRDGVTLAEGLLKIQGDEVTLVHASARNFLLSEETGVDDSRVMVSGGLEGLHHELAQSCYNDLLRSGLARSEMRVSELSAEDEPTMLKYAIKYFMEHVKASD